MFASSVARSNGPLTTAGMGRSLRLTGTTWQDLGLPTGMTHLYAWEPESGGRVLALVGNGSTAAPQRLALYAGSWTVFEVEAPARLDDVWVVGSEVWMVHVTSSAGNVPNPPAGSGPVLPVTVLNGTAAPQVRFLPFPSRDTSTNPTRTEYLGTTTFRSGIAALAARSTGVDRNTEFFLHEITRWPR